MKTKAAVRQVLKDAGSQPHFFDLSDGERLIRMIAMGYELGQQQVQRDRRTSRRKNRHQRV